MARYKVRSLPEAGRLITKIVGKKNRLYLRYTWENLVQKTPVDTYTASNSWFVTGGAPETFRPEYKFYGSRPDTPPYLLSDVAFKFKFGAYNNWFVTNTQPYLQYIEDGTTRSDQAPSGFIRLTVGKMTTIANAGGF